MSAEIARAFCVRMMTDEDFRAALAGVRETAEIDKIMADEKYSFTKDDLNKVVGEVVGHKLEDGELEKLVCGFYEEQMASGNPDACNRYTFAYQNPVAGEGHFIHTYMGDGNPLPSFEGEPKLVGIEGDIDTFTNTVWENLNADNKVSLFVRYIEIETGKYETRIINKNV